jgi:pyruvate/2-oxoglutarate dehydrogenase complex dihydrolipoamide acyltransferase (E2) component
MENMKYEVKQLTPFRLLSIYAYDAIRKGHNMYALVELDVTDIRQKLRSQRKEGRNVSFYGFLLSAIAKTLDENKELNHIRCGKKLYYFDEIDIDTAIELKLNGISIPRKYIVRDAAKKNMEEITLEINKAKTGWKESGSAGEDDKWALRWIKLASLLPKWYLKIIFRNFEKKPFKIKQRFGTTYVTSVSGFTDVSGFSIPYIEGGNRPLAFAIGSTVKKPGAVKSEIKIREYLSLTICINHDLVDGAPAARFINQLKQRIEGNLEY